MGKHYRRATFEERDEIFRLRGEGLRSDKRRRVWTARSRRDPLPSGSVRGMKSVLRTAGLGLVVLTLAACAGMPSDGVPTTAPAPAATGWSTPEPASDALPNRHQSLGGLMTPEEAKAAGLARARFAGLVGEPTSVFAKLTTLEQYVFTSSKGTGQLGSDAASVGWHPDRKVWVVAFRGKVKLAMPGSSGGTYDNITLALDARTGELIGTDAYPAGYAIPYQ